MIINLNYEGRVNSAYTSPEASYGVYTVFHRVMRHKFPDSKHGVTWSCTSKVADYTFKVRADFDLALELLNVLSDMMAAIDECRTAKE